MDWDEKYRKNDAPWDRQVPSLPLRQYLERHSIQGRVLVPGCGRGHEVALAIEYGFDAVGLDIAPTGIEQAKALYPHLKERFILGSLFDPPQELQGTFDFVFEHTCMSGLPPSLRPDYRRGIDLTLKKGGLLIGVWYINPDREPDHEGPPYSFSVDALTSLFAEGYEIVEDYVPDIAFEGRLGRERIRVLRKS
ncbi:MAG: methyltransferase domain-containing protein [Verrucomicrobiota bacterium]